MRGEPLSAIHIGYGAAWYIIPGFFTIAALGGIAKAMMFGFPIYREILPDGTTKKRASSAKAKIPKPKFLQNLSDTLSEKKGTGCLVIGFLIFLLIGSVAAMIS